MATAKARWEFVNTLASHLPNTGHGMQAIEHAANLIMRHSATLKRIAESQCNDDLPEAAAIARDAKDERLTARVTELAQSIGCGVRFSGDPRGCVVKLILPDGYTDDFGSTGFCVPTA